MMIIRGLARRELEVVVDHQKLRVAALARVLAKKMGDSMGQQIVIENVGGAAGTIGAGNVARAEPDGYTLIFGYGTQFTIAPSSLPGP